MKITDLIAKLQTMPQHADVLFSDECGEDIEYREIEVELGDVHDDAALVMITLAWEG